MRAILSRVGAARMAAAAKPQPSIRSTIGAQRCIQSSVPVQQTVESFKYDADRADMAMSAPMATSWKGVKRFYSRLDVKQDLETDHWQVLIDGRALRTNGMKDLMLPSKAIAIAIAGEFAAQGDYVLPATTPIYNLASSAIDNFVTEDMRVAEDLDADIRAHRLSTFDRIVAREQAEAQVAAQAAAARRYKGLPALDGAGSAGSAPSASAQAILAAAQKAESGLPSHAQALTTGRGEAMGGAGTGTGRLRDLALDYLETDTTCYRIDWDMADPGERLLRKRQDKYYQPLSDWFKASFGVDLGMAVGLEDLVHPEAAYQVAEDEVDTADPWLKAFYQQTLGVLKSTTLSLALAHRYIDVDGAFSAARVEEEWQIGEHGFVEDGHDSQRAYLKLQLASASAYLGMLPASQPRPLPSTGRKDYEAVLRQRIAEREARVAERRAREAGLVAKKRKVMQANALKEELEIARQRASITVKGSQATPKPALDGPHPDGDGKL